MLKLIIAFGKKDESTSTNSSEFLSLVIPFRNEENNLPTLLRCIAAQNLNPKYFEVLFVNDHSTDSSKEIIESFTKTNSKLYIKTIDQIIGEIGKKKAVQIGVKQAKGKYIIQTDADCHMPEVWLENIQNLIEILKPDLLLLPVNIQTNTSFLSHFDQIEFASQQAINFGLAKTGHAQFASAANMVYSKEAYFNANKIRKDQFISSGDDVFLLHAIKKNKGKIITYLNSKVLVQTKANDSLGSFLTQRKRWLSKNGAVPSISYKLTGLLFVSINILLLAHLLINTFLFIGLFFIKYSFEVVLINRYQNQLGIRTNPFTFLINSALYPVYLILILFYTLTGTNTWKGRKVTN